MKRGDIVNMVGRGDFSGKPRPALVVQDDLFNGQVPTVTVCPITSELTGLSIARVSIAAGGSSGLLRDSEVQIDKLQSVWTHRTGEPIGRAPDAVMVAVDAALRRWLSL